MHTTNNAPKSSRNFIHSIQPHQASYIPTNNQIKNCQPPSKQKNPNPRVCVSRADTRMSAVVPTDFLVPDPFPSDEDIRIDNANLDALAQSVTGFVDSQIFCFGLIYVLLGCMIAYIDCKRLKRWQFRVRRSLAA